MVSHGSQTKLIFKYCIVSLFCTTNPATSAQPNKMVVMVLELFQTVLGVTNIQEEFPILPEQMLKALGGQCLRMVSERMRCDFRIML